MSDFTGNSQPTVPPKEDDTQPIGPIKSPPRWRSIVLSVLAVLVLIGLCAFGGYTSGLGVRTNAENVLISKQLAEQYQYALVDIQFQRYDAARQRLEFIISHNPSYPGAQQTLTQVLVLGALPTATATATLTPTPDFSGAESAFQRAQQLIKAQDWPGALGALDTIRKLDPTYKTPQVDGMYYFALRNYGVDLIQKQGNLEGGIYQLTLAERFGPLDRSAASLREGARLYSTGASFWEIDWGQAVNFFTQVNAGWPSMWDGTLTSTQRYFTASERYGDVLYGRSEYCDAYTQYTNASAIGQLDAEAASNSNKAFQQCYPPTNTPENTATPPPVDTPTP